MRGIYRRLLALIEAIEEFLSKFMSLFIETHAISQINYQSAYQYILEDLKPSRLNAVGFQIIPLFHAEEKKKVEVLAATKADPRFSNLFWYKGWVPVMIFSPGSSFSFNDDSKTNPSLRINTIRGTVDIEQLVARAFQRQEKHGKCVHLTEVKSEGDNLSYLTKHRIFYAKQKNHGIKYLTADPTKLEIQNPSPKPYIFPKEFEPQIKDIEHWIKNRDWYEDRGIPWNKGYMLEGETGTGKSSFVEYIHFHLRISLFVIRLSSLNNRKLLNFFDSSIKSIDTPRIHLYEDIDTVFEGRKALCDVDFDTFLNGISGVNNQEGVLNFFTTNRLENLDEALATRTSEGQIMNRPGRVDRVLTFKSFDEGQRRVMAERIARGNSKLVEDLITRGEGMTGAAFQEFCREQVLGFEKII